MHQSKYRDPESFSPRAPRPPLLRANQFAESSALLVNKASLEASALPQ